MKSELVKIWFKILIVISFVFFPFLNELYGQKKVKLLRTEKPIANKYIVVFKDEVLPENVAVSEQVDSLAHDLANAYNGKIGYLYRAVIKGFSIETTGGSIKSWRNRKITKIAYPCF